MQSEIIVYNTVQFIPNVGLDVFGLLQSAMHMAWLRSVGGRMKSDYQYSIKLVYNNFPWPALQGNIHKGLEACAQAVLDARASHPNASLADLYDPLTMPANLPAFPVFIFLSISAARARASSL